jgi:hypothetical protein
MTGKGRRAGPQRMLVSSLVSPVREENVDPANRFPKNSLSYIRVPGRDKSLVGNTFVVMTRLSGGQVGAPKLRPVKPVHASSSPFYFGCTMVWDTYIAVSGLTD